MKNICILLLFFILPIAQASSKCDIVIARVFDTDICNSEIPESTSSTHNRRNLFTSRQMRFIYLLRNISYKKLLKNDTFVTNDNEVNLYIRFRKLNEEKALLFEEEMYRNIHKLLITNQYDDIQKKILSKALEKEKYIVIKRLKIKNHYKNLIIETGESSKRVLLSKKEIERIENERKQYQKTVLQLKFRRAMYNKYHGTITSDTLVMDPIGARLSLLKDIKRRGKLEIYIEEFSQIYDKIEKLDTRENRMIMLGYKHMKFKKPIWEQTIDLERIKKYYLKKIEYYQKLPMKNKT